MLINLPQDNIIGKKIQNYKKWLAIKCMLSRITNVNFIMWIPFSVYTYLVVEMYFSSAKYNTNMNKKTGNFIESALKQLRSACNVVV